MSPLDEEMEKEAPSTSVMGPPEAFFTVAAPLKVQGSVT